MAIDAVQDWQLAPGDQLIGQGLGGLGLAFFVVIEHGEEGVLEGELHVLVEVDARESGTIFELAWFGKALNGVTARQGLGLLLLVGHGRARLSFGEGLGVVLLVGHGRALVGLLGNVHFTGALSHVGILSRIEVGHVDKTAVWGSKI